MYMYLNPRLCPCPCLCSLSMLDMHIRIQWFIHMNRDCVRRRSLDILHHPIPTSDPIHNLLPGLPSHLQEGQVGMLCALHVVRVYYTVTCRYITGLLTVICHTNAQLPDELTHCMYNRTWYPWFTDACRFMYKHLQHHWISWVNISMHNYDPH